MEGEMVKEAVANMFKSQWPRLYLDTAELISISRGQLPASFISEFVDVVYKHSVVLVISHAHLRDALKPGDSDAPELLTTALEPFWIRGLVTSGPMQIEPWKSDHKDIVIESWANVRELLTTRQASTNLRQHDMVQSINYAADITYKAVQQAAAPDKKSYSNKQDAICTAAVWVTSLGLQKDIESAVDWCAQSISYALTKSERELLLKRLKPAEAALEIISPLASMLSEEELLNLWPILSDDGSRAPGFWLAMRLAADRAKNVQRSPSRSDSVDLDHCTHFPYVDIATCDKQTFFALQPYFGKFCGSRQPAIFRNGKLQDVLAHIQSLPTRQQYFEQAILHSNLEDEKPTISPGGDPQNSA